MTDKNDKSKAQETPPETKSEAKPEVDQATLMAQMVQGFNSMATAINAMSEKVGDLAKHHVAAPRRHFEAVEQNLGRDTTLMYADDNSEIILDETPVDPNDPNFNKKMAQMAFDREMLTIHMHDVSDATAEKVVTAAVNGRIFHFPRGSVSRVPRMIVEVLARARPVSYSTQEFLNAQGKPDVREVSTTGLRYPFSLVDAKPADQKWLNSILRSPQ